MLLLSLHLYKKKDWCGTSQMWQAIFHLILSGINFRLGKTMLPKQNATFMFIDALKATLLFYHDCSKVLSWMFSNGPFLWFYFHLKFSFSAHFRLISNVWVGVAYSQMPVRIRLSRLPIWSRWRCFVHKFLFSQLSANYHITFHIASLFHNLGRRRVWAVHSELLCAWNMRTCDRFRYNSVS